MAKTQIKNYVFKPGMGGLENLYPNAYSLLTSNKSFLQKEVNAYITQKVLDAKQYTPQTATYQGATGVMELTIIPNTMFTPTTGTYNPSSGDTVLTIGTHSLTVGQYIKLSTNGITWSNTSNTQPVYPTYAIRIDAVSSTTITVNIGLRTDDVSAHTFVSALTNSVVLSHNFNVGDAINIATHGITFRCALDGNATLHPYPRPVGVPNASGHDPYYNKPIIITDISTATVSVNVGISSDTSVHTFESAVTDGVSDVFFNYVNTSADKCERDVGLILDAYKNDLRYGGNEKTYKYVNYYWDNGVAQVDGDRGPELASHALIQRLLTDYIFQNTTYPQVLNSEVTQTTNSTNGEAVASTRIDTLSNVVINVIHNGVSSLPTYEENTIGKLSFQGRYDQDEILIATNTTTNNIIYNFADANAGAKVELQTKGPNENFQSYLQATDAVTMLWLNANTESQSTTDDIQIFVEKIENGKSVQTVRPYDFGTDAIERMRIAPPLSMLDADFEYGLQPTKWSAIAMMRGYPSVYEIPGTSSEVLSVVTDASAGTSGIGASLITVTTVAPHGFESGTPITIKALENAVSGAARGEGSFVIVETPTDNTFTYYAKSKVGTNNGDVLSTGYTQLREAGFYTGAGIANADFQVVSNGSAGTMVTELSVPTGSNTLPYDGNSPEVGSPLSGTGIPLGSQVTNFVDNSAGGGEFSTLEIAENAVIGDTDIEVVDSTGILANLALDRGDGTAIFVNNIVGNTLTMSGGLTSNLASNTKTYTGVLPSTEPVDGLGATFNISRTGGSYSLDAIATAGVDYKAGDRLKVLGTILGGTTPTNDCLIYVDSVATSPLGAITSVTLSGTAISGTATFNGAGAVYEGGNGRDVLVDVTLNNNVYSIALNAGDVSDDFIANDTFRILGSNLGGIDSTNDAICTVTSIGTVGARTGAITGISIAGTAADADVVYSDVTYTTSSAGGTSATVEVRRVGTVYQAIIPLLDGGAGYSIGDQFVVDGGDLGGASTTNNCTITVDNVDGSGSITASSAAGVSVNTESFTTGIIEIINPTGATFDVDLNATVYTITLATGGANYAPNQELKILGNLLGGATPTNDIVITVLTVDAAGAVLTFNSTGSGNNGTLAYTNITPQADVPAGAGAEFTIRRINGTYDNILITQGGTGYEIGNTLFVPGSSLDGDGTHDLTFFITGVNAGAVTSYTPNFTSANPGDSVPLICTFTMSEVTTETVPVATVISFSELATIEATFDTPHGIVPGNSFITVISSDDGSNNHLLASGAFLATNIPTTNKLRFVARSAGSISTSAVDVISGTFYTRPDSFFIHRPFDGGVQLGTGGPQHGAQAIRQSKKYIRYQSGKGIMYTTGALFAPSYDLASVTADGTEVNSLITITTDDNDHGVQVGGIIRLLSVESSGYNSGSETVVPPEFDYTVQEVVNERSFKVRAIRRLADTTEYLEATAIADWPLVQVFDEVLLDTNTSDVHDFFLNEVAYDGRKWGDFNESDSITTDDKTALTNHLQGISQTATIDNRVKVALAELKSRRNLGTVEDTVPVMKQEAVLGFGSQMSVVAWHGATVRSGIFDDQNGIFWEFDGQNVSVNQRTGTQQLAGTCAIDVDSNTVTGTSTRFRDQTKAGDRIIIRGMTHVVSHVVSQTEINVTPDFRGVTDITGAKANLVVDKKVKQSDFNLDSLDGNGPSGYDIDIAKMQMIGIQYSWYGAGFIDFMLRGADGNFVFAHRMRNSNVNTEAFMRSGNLPVRYEVTNEGYPAKLAAAVDDTQTTLTLLDSSFFPDFGTVYIDNEIISFTANNKTTNTLTGCTRGTSLTNFQSGAERTYSAGAAAAHVDKTGVVLISNTITPLISHWGSAFLTDGGFDEDRGYIFSYAETGLNANTIKQTAFMLRLAPSVSNAIIGDLGERELLNRAQLLLQGLEITSDGFESDGTPIQGGIVIEGVLNPQNYPINPADVGWTGLSSVAQGGQPSFAQVASGGSVNWTTDNTVTNTIGTQIASPTGTLDSGLYTSYNRNSTVYVNATDFRNTFGTNVGAVFGATIVDNIQGRIPANTTITGGYIPGSGDYGYLRLSNRLSGNISQNSSGRFDITLNAALVNRNYAYIDSTSYAASGITLGTPVTESGGSVVFPANTSVASISQKVFGTVTYYEVQFNNAFTGTLAAGSGTIQFAFSQPPFAQPGETVFSFIANPGERSTVDFSELKELTNTTLGGRGTFPNGPDVLAINVYKVAGANTNSNLILRWGEAQA